MRLSNMADYAVVVMGAAARHCGGARTSATELASETGIALPTVQKLVSILGKAGLLRSARGLGGGIQPCTPGCGNHAGRHYRGSRRPDCDDQLHQRRKLQLRN